jgi:type I restriction-modification system DNA methylase subunit
MPPAHHVALFHPRLVRGRMATLDASLFAQHKKATLPWLDHLRKGTLDDTKETSLHGGFLERIFGDVLGYRTMALAAQGKWDLVAEKSVHHGGSADGAVGFFAKGESRVVAPIELKGAAQFLEHAKGRALTPIQQGWDYANKAPESRWIIVSNYRETRLYAKSKGQGAYELFLLEDLATEAGFLRFVALLGRDALLGGPSADSSPLAEMLLASEHEEREVTERLYGEYRGIRARLFDELRRTQSNATADELLAYAQTILDRVLFVAFAEDRQLLPPNTLVKAYEYKDPYHPRAAWQNFVAVFGSIDKGNARLDIPGYNGGLFTETAELAALDISDETCKAFTELATYDFAEDVSVDVLGHIFEQSITDLERLRQEAAVAPPDVPDVSTGTQKIPSMRKIEGIFYTPAFITSFLVRETLGHALAEAWERAAAGRGASKKEKIATWEAYQSELRGLRVLDPACGSGAFLVAAFDALAQEFDRANRGLAELRGKQASLFDLTRTVLNENLFGLDKSGESVEITKLSLWLKTAERGKRLTFLDRNVRQGNSVVTEPMVDPRAFSWTAGRVAQSFLEPEPPAGEDAGAIDARWRGGFDVVIGNPPYVRQELLLAYKEHWKANFRAFDGTADLFVYFFERGLEQLKPGGRLGFIVSNKWLRGGYAEKLRTMFANECTIDTLVDFGHAPVFPDADAFPCIVTMRKQKAPPDHAVSVTLYPRELLGKEVLASYVEAHRFDFLQSNLGAAGWSLERPEEQALLEKLRKNGVPLNKYASLKPYYGIKTGCNEAFLVDQATKERLCREDPGSAEILKKYLRGQDVSRWVPEWAGLWMIFTRHGIDIDRYPAIKAHLETHRAALEPRPRGYRGHSKDWPGRKPGAYKWYEIQDAIDYYELFEQPKLVYQEIQFHPAYALDRTGLFLNNKAFLMRSEDPWLLAVLNSPAMWWHNWRYLVHMKDEALSPAGDKIVHVPIPRPSTAQLESTAAAVESIVELTRTVKEATAGVLDLLRVQYQVETPGQALADFATLGSDGFVGEVINHRPKKGLLRLSTAGLKALRKLFETEAPGVLEKRAKILCHERAIAAAVHAAYGLTKADLEILRATAPPRMPPGW